MDRIVEHTTQRLHIESYASDGAGIARLDGAVVFVKGAVRGETCQVFLDKVGRSAVWGHVTAVEVASSSRLEPDCPYYERCGGCCYRRRP